MWIYSNFFLIVKNVVRFRNMNDPQPSINFSSDPFSLSLEPEFLKHLFTGPLSLADTSGVCPLFSWDPLTLGEDPTFPTISETRRQRMGELDSRSPQHRVWECIHSTQFYWGCLLYKVPQQHSWIKHKPWLPRTLSGMNLKELYEKR